MIPTYYFNNIINIQMQGLSEFKKWIKIHIGEPIITAIDLDNEWVAFGSISIYLGFYNIQKNYLKYI